MTSQPGWHLDPVPPQPGQPAQLRYWDGTRWTEHVAPTQAPAQPAAQPQAPVQPQAPAAWAPPGPGGQPAPYAGVYGSTGPAAQPPAGPYAAAYAGAYAGTKPPATTPDGVPLAGWWQRVLASVLDGLIIGIVGALVALPWWRDVVHIYRDWFDDALRSDGSTSSLDTAGLQSDLLRPLAIIAGINLALGLIYNVAFLMWKQGTPGKLMVGLRVRLRERPGPLPIGTILLRWVGQYGPGVLGIVPFVGTLTGFYSLLDALWPLWDDKKQALHDKLAKTNVVRVR